MNLLDALRERILIVDGGMGTRLRGLGFDGPIQDGANLEAPDLVRKVHAEFHRAGAEVIETNTFSANPFRLNAAGSELDFRALNLAGVSLAREAAAGAYIMGSIGPCGSALMPLGTIAEDEAFEAFYEQAMALAEAGVDGFLLETFADLGEMAIAIKAVRQISGDAPIVACKSFIEDGETLAEGFPMRAAIELRKMGADVVGANCVVGPQRMYDVIRWMAEGGETPICALPTPGMPQLIRKQLAYDTTPEYFGGAAARLAEAGANMIGGCCGTTPEHIAALSAALKDRKPRVRAHVRTADSAVKKPLESSEPSGLSRQLGKKFLVSVELDLPRGLDTGKVLAGAKSLKEKGADIIDISDGARARLRMTPVAVCALVQGDAGIETMMHVSCRDRNLLALQADLLGAHALGIRNVLAITGDPANIGDFPSATSVFDIDAIGLVRVLSRFNEGIDMAGNGLGRKCAFTIGVAFNPAAHDMAFESDRLKKKADAGAHLLYTQPLFELRHLELAVKGAKALSLPLLVGVLPLRSARHAEFMHNEVPGIDIPDWLRKKMAEADEASAVEVGIAVAQEFASEVRSSAEGIYLMPPFGNHQIAERVMEALTL